MYELLARYYDVLHEGLSEDIDLLLELAETDAANEVLELGCGTGRIMRPLVEAGVAVTGVDVSAEMLTIARQKIDSPLATFVEADMTSFTLSKTFALCVISHNTLMHLNQAQLSAALRQVHAHLQTGGRLIIDVENPFVMASMEAQATFEPEDMFLDPASGLSVTPYAKWRVDSAEQQNVVSWRYEREDGVIVSAEIDYHYHFPHLIQLLLQKNGLRWQTAYGDYDQSEFEEDSARLIVIAGKV